MVYSVVQALRTRALVWSAEHLLRANRNLGRRLVCFSDNLPVVLSAVKGRSKSRLLLGPLRKLAALSIYRHEVKDSLEMGSVRDQRR